MAETLVLDPVPRSAPVARRWVAQRLAELDRGELVDVAELLTTEAVTNALLHAGTRIEVTLHPVDHGVRIQVSDGSPTEPVPRHPTGEATVGRGLGMLEQLADSWGWTVTGRGKIIWFVICGQQGSGQTPPVRKRVGPAAASESGLGRYEVERSDDLRGPVTVRLLGLPLRLLLAAQEHHDAVLRELQLLDVSATEVNVPLPADLERLVDGLGVRRGFARSRRDREVLDAQEKGLMQIDQTFTTHTAAVGRLRDVGDLMNLADSCSENGLLLTLPRAQLVREFSRWYLDQLLTQVEGRPPTPWSGPLTPGSAAP